MRNGDFTEPGTSKRGAEDPGDFSFPLDGALLELLAGACASPDFLASALVCCAALFALSRSAAGDRGLEGVVELAGLDLGVAIVILGCETN